MSDSFSDGSSVRIRVAQYFVNEKLEELKSENPPVKIGDWEYLQALPQYRVYEDESESAQQGDDSELVLGAQEPPLPPIIPSHPDDGDHISWNNLHEKLKDGIFDAEKPKIIPQKLIYPPWYRVAIIGAGVSGLRTAMLLQERGIPYKIFEASDRPGGHLFTYQFPSNPPDNPQGSHDYYDVGAMRFPDNEASSKTFKLFDELGLIRQGKVLEYILSIDENIRYYNGIKTTVKVANTAGDHFNDEPFVEEKYLDWSYVDPWGREHSGVEACTLEAFDRFREPLVKNVKDPVAFKKALEELMKYDWASTRSYLTREKPKYPLPVVHWMETRNNGTGGYDTAFSEAIIDSLEFDDPTKKVEWKRLEGGTKVLVDAMLDKLRVKPVYSHRVTSVEQVYLPPFQCFPDLSDWGNWRRWRRYPFPLLRVSAFGKRPEYFAHVVSTVALGDLGIINTDRVLMSYKQRQAIRTMNYGEAVKVAIKFKTRWWEKDPINQRGGVSCTDRPIRWVVYPSYGIDEEGPGVLMVTYNWQQDASRFGALIHNPDWSEQLDPDRERPWSEKVLLDQIYEDLAALHGPDVTKHWLQNETLDYHAFNWYQNPYTMGAYAHFAPGQARTFFADLNQPAARGRFHFGGEAAGFHHPWVSGALDSAERVVNEILRWDFPIWFPKFKLEKSSVFRDEESAEKLFVRGLVSKELEEVGF